MHAVWLLAKLLILLRALRRETGRPGITAYRVGAIQYTLAVGASDRQHEGRPALRLPPALGGLRGQREAQAKGHNPGAPCCFVCTSRGFWLHPKELLCLNRRSRALVAPPGFEELMHCSSAAIGDCGPGRGLQARRDRGCCALYVPAQPAALCAVPPLMCAAVHWPCCIRTAEQGRDMRREGRERRHGVGALHGALLPGARLRPAASVRPCLTTLQVDLHTGTCKGSCSDAPCMQWLVASVCEGQAAPLPTACPSNCGKLSPGSRF